MTQSRTGKAAQAYELLERLIVQEVIEPGALVSESSLMELTGLGRTPVREALQLLARNRMVEIHPNRGVLIPPASVETQLRMLELRRVLEVLAVRLAATRATDEVRAAMEAMLTRLSTEVFTLAQYAETVRQTHALIVAGADNPYLGDAIAPLQGLSRRFWYSQTTDEQAEIARGSALHRAILTAVVAGDEDGAERASTALNDYLVDFTLATLDPRRPRGRRTVR